MEKENKIIKDLKEAKERIDKGEFVTEKEFFENKPLSEEVKIWKNPWGDKCSAVPTIKLKATNKRIIERLKKAIPSNYISFNDEVESQGITFHHVIDKIFKEEMGKGLI